MVSTKLQNARKGIQDCEPSIEKSGYESGLNERVTAKS
jgi:hypothetical protein